MPSVGAKIGTTSKYRGVTLFLSQGEYQAFVKSAGKRVHCGMWIREEDAAIARDRAALHFELNAPQNYPQKSKRLGPATPEALVAVARAQQRQHESSRHKGVYWDSGRNRWAAIVCVRRKGIQVAQFDDEKTAAQAHDYAARMLLGTAAELNFPTQSQRFKMLKRSDKWARSSGSREHQVGIVESPETIEAKTGLQNCIMTVDTTILGTSRAKRKPPKPTTRPPSDFGESARL